MPRKVEFDQFTDVDIEEEDFPHLNQLESGQLNNNNNSNNNNNNIHQSQHPKSTSYYDCGILGVIICSTGAILILLFLFLLYKFVTG